MTAMPSAASTPTETPQLPEATALTDAALRLLAAFFTDRESLGKFLEGRLDALAADSYLAVSPGPFVDASEVLRYWESRAEYLDSQGTPALLTTAAVGELSRLACPGLEPAVVLETLRQAGAVEPAAAGWRMTARAALIRGANQAAHVRAALMATRLLETLHANLASSDPADHLFERAAVVPRIPVSQLPAVKAFLVRHGQQFLEDADDTLARLADPATPSSDRTGVGVFLFRDPVRTKR